MPAGPWQSYDKLPHLVLSGALDVPGSSYKLALFTSASDAANLGNDEYGDLTDEVAAANGYTAGGVALTSPAVAQVDRDARFTAADLTPAFTATGGSIVFRYRVIYAVGSIGGLTNPLIAMALGDAADVDITIPSSDSLNEIFDPTLGIFSVLGST